MRGVGLLKHENEVFTSQMVMLSGHAHVNCQFHRCTLVVTNAPMILEGCEFFGCNFRLEFDLLIGDPGTHQTLRSILDLMDNVDQVDLSIVN